MLHDKTIDNTVVKWFLFRKNLAFNNFNLYINLIKFVFI